MLIHHPRSAAPVPKNAAAELMRQKRRARPVRTPVAGATVRRSKADSNPAQPVRSGRAWRPNVHQDYRFGGKRALFLRDTTQTCPPRARCVVELDVQAVARRCAPVSFEAPRWMTNRKP